MKVRSVVIGHKPDGNAIVASDTEVDDQGCEMHLRAGGAVVQNGNARRNRSQVPCHLVGAHQS